MIELCLKQRMMAFFFDQMVSSAQLTHVDQFKHVKSEESSDHQMHPWLSVCDLIPDRKKAQSKLYRIAKHVENGKTITKAIIHQQLDKSLEPATKRQRLE